MRYDDMIEFSFGMWGEQNWDDLLSNLASVDVLKQALHGLQMGHRPYKDIARALEHIYRHLCTCKYTNNHG